MTRAHLMFYNAELGRDQAARIYKHADGYPDGPKGVLQELWKLYRRLSLTRGEVAELAKQKSPLAYLRHHRKDTLADYVTSIYGQRLDDPDWAAAEFITLFRQSMAGNVYVTATVHGDESFLYEVNVTRTPWFVTIKQQGPHDAEGNETWVITHELSLSTHKPKTVIPKAKAAAAGK